MKKIIAISFVFIFLCANTEIGQLLKLPNLIEHYREHLNHKDEYNVSFIDFVKSHYNDNQKHSDTDQHDEHKNLPFKTINSHISIIAVFDNQPISFTKPINLALNYSVPCYRESYSSNFSACIWLPPKIS